MPPGVTWLLPVHNGEDYLERTLISIAEQDYPAHAHAVYAWDDGSTDGTADILRKWIGREVRGRIIGSDRVGLGRALARLTVSAPTELLARIDADDAAAPDRLAQQVAYLCEHRRVGVLGTQMRRLGSEAVITSHPTNDAELRWAMRFTNPVSHPSVMLRRSAVLEAGNYRDLPPGQEDYDLWVRMALIVRFATLDQPLLHYRIHDQSVTADWRADHGTRFYHQRNALVDRLLPGVATSDAIRLLELVRRPEELGVSAADLARFRDAARLAARACRYAPDYFTATPLFKQQFENLKTRYLKGRPIIRPLWPILKRARSWMPGQSKPANNRTAAA